MAIHHEIEFKCGVADVFDALMNAEKFAAFSGGTAEIDPSEGGAFACFDGMIIGRSIEIAKNERLVQAWRVANWDAGVYSIVRFELVDLGEAGTRIVFDHTGYPEEHEPHLDSGWHERYWNPMRSLLEG